jgi:hypothetical protein
MVGQAPGAAQGAAACRVYGATLLIAKLDRLSRDPHFLLGLDKAGRARGDRNIQAHQRRPGRSKEGQASGAIDARRRRSAMVAI